MNKLIICIYLFLLFCSVVVGQPSTKTVECKVDSSKKFKYKIIAKERTINEPYIFSIRVVIKDNKKFNKENMLKFTENIKARFCNEERISVVIFDDEKTANESRVVADYLLDQRKAPELRGFYSLDRKTGSEGIQFSTKRGNPTDEVKIDIPNLAKQQ
jgi:hypothetical protein